MSRKHTGEIDSLSAIDPIATRGCVVSATPQSREQKPTVREVLTLYLTLLNAIVEI